MAQLPQFEEFDIAQPAKIEQVKIEEPNQGQPKQKLGQITKVEKMISLLLVGCALITAFFTVKMTTTISKAEETVSLMQIKNDTQQDVVNKLEQEKNELSRTEKVKAAAEKGGLEIVDDNIRNVD